MEGVLKAGAALCFPFGLLNEFIIPVFFLMCIYISPVLSSAAGNTRVVSNADLSFLNCFLSRLISLQKSRLPVSHCIIALELLSSLSPKRACVIDPCISWRKISLLLWKPTYFLIGNE